LYGSSILFKYEIKFFFSGDRSVICETRLQRNFVVQVILTDKPIPSTSIITTTEHLTTTINDHSNSSLIEQT
jgi:hypothetical protein